VNRQTKEDVVAQLRDRFSRASVALLATNHGLTVEESTQLRRQVRAAGGEMRVAKLTLTKLALTDTAYGGLSDLLAGPRGLVFGFDDPVAVAKALVDFAKDHDKLGLDGGAMEGQVLEAESVKRLATMPDLPTLQAMIVSQARGPGQRLAGQVAGPAARIAGAITALVKKLEKEGAAE
jgi:large subunit ribosomal protein L10